MSTGPDHDRDLPDPGGDDDPPTARQAPPSRGAPGEEELGAVFQDDIPTAYEESIAEALAPPEGGSDFHDPYARVLSDDSPPVEEDELGHPESEEFQEAMATVALGQRGPGLPLDLADEEPTADVDDMSPEARPSPPSPSGSTQDRIDTASFEREASVDGLLDEGSLDLSRSTETSFEVSEGDIIEAGPAEPPPERFLRDTAAFEAPSDEELASSDLDEYEPYGAEPDDSPTLVGDLGEPRKAADEVEEPESPIAPPRPRAEPRPAFVVPRPSSGAAHASRAAEAPAPATQPRPASSAVAAWMQRDEVAEVGDDVAYEQTAIASAEGSVDLLAPSFEAAVDLVSDEDPELARRLSTSVSRKLRSEVTSVGSGGSGSALPEVSEEHRELDPRPFLESLRRNPGDRAAFRAVQRIYAASERWGDLVALLLEQSELEHAVPRRLELLAELAEVLADNLGEPDKALMALLSALLLEPRSDMVADRLEALTARTGLWGELFAELGQAASQEPHAGRRAALCARMGEWYLRAGHVAYAQPCFEQALAANPGELRALVGMARVFEQAGDAEGYAQVVARIPPALPPGLSPDLLMRLAALQERRGDDRAAAAALDAVLEGDPGNAEALEALERVLGRQQRWGDLAERLEARAEKVQVVDPDGAAELLRRVARLQVEQVGDLRTAERACRAALDLGGPDAQVLEILEGIYAQGSRWPELAWVLEQQLEATDSSRERVALLTRLAGMDETEFLKPESAAERWGQVLELEPRNELAHGRRCELLGRLGRWPELVEALERRAAAALDDPARAASFAQAGRVLFEEVGESERAILHLKRACKLDRSNQEAAALLADVLERSGNAAEAFDAFVALAQASADPAAGARALVRAAGLARESLGRRQEALDLLERAVTIDPGQREAAEVLRRERAGEGDWEGAARAIEIELDHAAGPAARGKRLLELAAILREHLGRPGDAIGAYEEARAAVGDGREVLAPLFELYVEAGRKAEAAGIAEAFARSAPRDDPARGAADSVRGARVLAEVGHPERARALVDHALRLDPAHDEGLGLLAELSERAGDWERAFAALEALAEARGGVLPVALAVRAGRAARMCGRNEDAERRFESVLAAEPGNNEALRQLAAIAQGRGESARALELLGRVEVKDEEMRLSHLHRLADLAREASDDGALVSVLQRALETRPDDRKSLTMLVDALSRQEDWAGAVEAIRSLAESAKDDKRARAKYFSAAAVILRDKVGDLEAAARTYESILDDDWSDLAVFETIDRMLTAAREYRLQEKVYRRMIHRVSGKGRPEVEVQLWHALGEIYRSRLHKFEEAAEAFAAAARLEPDNVQRQVILAELNSALGRHDEAVRRHKELLRLDSSRVDSLRAIREVYSATADYDRAFSVVSALAARGAASGPELEFFEQWLPRPMVAATAPLDDEAWLVHLRHPDEDPYVSGIFSTILTFALAQRVRPAKEFGLGPATAVDFARSGGGLLAQQFVAVARVLGVPVPQLHVVRDTGGTMAYALTDPPASIFGGLVTQISDAERVFLLGRHLAFYQGGRYMSVAYPTRAELAAILLSAVAAVTGQDAAVPPTAKPFLDKLRGWLRGAPHVGERLADVVRRFLERGGKVDIERWLRGAELTACRAGLLLVSDPRVAASGLRIDPKSPANVPAKDRMEELLRFVISDEYTALRAALGVRVG